MVALLSHTQEPGHVSARLLELRSVLVFVSSSFASLRVRLAATTATTSPEAASAAEASEAHSTPEQAHDLREKNTLVAATPTELIAATHPSDRLTLGLDCELPAPEQ